MCMQCNIAALNAPRKFHRRTFFYVQHNKNNSENTPKIIESFIYLFIFFLCCMKQTFLSDTLWSYSIKRFCEAQLLLVNHKTCFKRSILERMFDFKNVHKQFYFKNNMAQREMTDE